MGAPTPRRRWHGRAAVCLLLAILLVVAATGHAGLHMQAADVPVAEQVEGDHDPAGHAACSACVTGIAMAAHDSAITDMAFAAVDITCSNPGLRPPQPPPKA